MKKSLRLKALLTLLVGLFLSIGAFAQQIAVKGHVKDTTGEPVIGANVLVKGTTNGTITDFDGNFMLNVPKDAILSVSFVGYKSAEVKAASSVIVTLEDDSQVLDAVVVIGYGSVKKNDMTGSVTAIKPDKLNKGLITNAQDMMTGKIAGVSVVSKGGAPGAGATIRIRGGSSLTAENDPLIVIDGLAMDNKGVKGLSNPLSMVNPNDIESFTVLKDASATAIYGTRGINGVIVLKLKTPQQMKEEKTIKQIDELLKPRGVDRRNARYYINGKEVPASTAYQTNIEQMEVKTGADGTLEIYIKPMIFLRGEYE